MEKKSTNAVVIAISVLAVCVVAVVCVLVLKANGSGGVIKENKPKKDKTETSTTQTADENRTHTYFEEQPGLVIPSETVTDVQQTAPVVPPVTNAPATNPPVTAPQLHIQAPVVDKPEDVTTPPQLDPDSMSSGQATKPPSSTSGNLPKDMSLAGLYGMGYDVYGFKEYIFNDDTDPECIQADFGYNRLYDWGAQFIDFSIDTVRMPFEYGGKEYMIQAWKGQYISGELGTVGGEVGLYTRPKGTISAIGHYDCAPREEWLNMEMTVLWDEQGNGNYLPQFTRVYEPHWWPTGFVFGNLANKKDTDPLRVLCRITFKDEEMAQAFAASLSKEGFRSVSDFDPNVIDTYKIHGKDVIFIWQDAR